MWAARRVDRSAAIRNSLFPIPYSARVPDRHGQGPAKRIGGDGLGQDEIELRTQFAVDGWEIGQPGQENDWLSRRSPPDRARQLVPTHLLHCLIGDDDVKLALKKLFQSFSAVSGGLDA